MNKGLDNEPVIVDERMAWSLLSKIKNTLCKHAKLDVDKYDVEGKVLPHYRVLISIEDCQNERRNGSAYCQPCSDKYNNR